MAQKIVRTSAICWLFLLIDFSITNGQSVAIGITGSANGQPLLAANAGTNISQTSSTFTMAATIPSVGTSAWSLVSGMGAITDPLSANTTVTGVTQGTTVLRWTVSLGSCSQSADVTLTVLAPPMVSLKVFLQGAYINGAQSMSTVLKTLNLVPLTYAQEITTQSVIDNNSVVDWIIIELRDAQTPTLVLFTLSALLLSNGSIVDVNGTSPVSFTQAIAGNYFICLKHRNHLRIRTQNTVSINNGNNNFDFTNGSLAILGETATLETSIKGMISGDVNQDGSIDANDRSDVWNNRNISSYNINDCNLNGSVDASDRSIIWNNRNKSAGFQ